MCHCTDCQTLSGTAFRTVASVKKENLKLLSGEPKVYIKTAESGNKRAQAFCACGLRHAVVGDDAHGSAGRRSARRCDAPAQRIETEAAGVVTLGARLARRTWHYSEAGETAVKLCL